jgi:hypothetical protein
MKRSSALGITLSLGHCEIHHQEGYPHLPFIRVQNGPGFALSLAPDRPNSGGFVSSFPDNPVSTSVGETEGFMKRKTGLFSALWIEDLGTPFGAGERGGRQPKECLFWGSDPGIFRQVSTGILRFLPDPLFMRDIQEFSI